MIIGKYIKDSNNDFPKNLKVNCKIVKFYLLFDPKLVSDDHMSDAETFADPNSIN